MDAFTRNCSNCGATVRPRGGQTPQFCSRCGQNLDDTVPLDRKAAAYTASRDVRPARVRREGVSGTAIASLVVGIIGLIPMCGPIPALIAIGLGSSAKDEIRVARGALGGGGLATAGMVLGCIGAVLGVLVCAGTVL